MTKPFATAKGNPLMRHLAAGTALLIILGLAGCSGDDKPSATPETVYVNRVVDYSPEIPSGETLGAGFYDSSKVIGSSVSSLDVVSLGSDSDGPGGSITVGFGTIDGSVSFCIYNVEGIDFTVHENPFSFSDSTGAVNFTEAAYVEVSQDNVNFYRFPATFPVADASLVGKPESYANMAGITVGGDGFDLWDIIRTNQLSGGFRACYLRIVDGGTEVPDYGSNGVFADNSPSGADIESVTALGIPYPGLTP